MENLEKICKKIRLAILKSSYEVGACHIGSALSAVEIIVSLYWKILKKNDVFIFGKASGASALYCVLAERGIIKKSKVNEYLKKYPLANSFVPGVTTSVGSVGMGLSTAVGLALSNRKKRVYCLISDGQLDEGVTYEAALFSRQHKLNNLYVICDNNKYQATGATKDILDLTTSFKFMTETFPNLEIVNTIKGRGVSFLENNPIASHYMNLDKQKYEQAIEEIG